MDLKQLTIMVGRNNAGKSTLIEAMRILSVITSRYQNINYTKPPVWVKEEIDNGITPSLANLNISSKNIFHLYGDPPSIIEAVFDNGTKVKAFIGEEATIFAVIYDSDGHPIRSKKQALQIFIPKISVLPQISPLLEEEKVIQRQTTLANMPTKLSSRNFRNQIFLFPQNFDRFKDIAEKTWGGLQINKIDSGTGFVGDSLSLFVRDNNFTAEIGWMGHGLQMWLQTMWFLARCNFEETIILDEPDVYMHADLQRKLIKIIKPLFSQIIIATHSVEIMEEVEPDCILPIDNKRRKLIYANKNTVVQRIIENFGSTHNIDIARLFSSKKVLIVEGENSDIAILGVFHSIMYPHSFHPFTTIPKIYINGWGGWQRVIGASDVFSQSHSDIKTYCIFDSDYHLDKEISDRYIEALKHKIDLHIWCKKEIENYTIKAEVIYRYLSKKKMFGDVTLEIVKNKMQELVEEFKNETIDNYGSSISNMDKSKTYKTISKEAAKIVKDRWTNPFDIICGKDFIKKLCTWSKSQYGVSLTAYKLAEEFHIEEIFEEMKTVLARIESNAQFDYPST